MPQRFLRPGILHSGRWNSVRFDAQSFYIRLITLVDDYGRCDGRPSVLVGCFLVWNDRNPQHKIDARAITKLLRILCEAELIEWYELDGKQVVQITQWQERIRENTKPKFPERTRLAASCCTILPSSPSPTPSPTPSIICPNGKEPLASPAVSDLDSRAIISAEQIYSAYPRKVGKPRALMSIRGAMRVCKSDQLLAKTTAYAKAVAGIVEDRFIPHAATWFNQQRFNDDPKTWTNGTGQKKLKEGRDPDELMSERLWNIKHGKRR